MYRIHATKLKIVLLPNAPLTTARSFKSTNRTLSTTRSPEELIKKLPIVWRLVREKVIMHTRV
jgi:hypothetical protein